MWSFILKEAKPGYNQGFQLHVSHSPKQVMWLIPQSMRQRTSTGVMHSWADDAIKVITYKLSYRLYAPGFTHLNTHSLTALNQKHNSSRKGNK